jgi:hypothetical protein
MVRQKADLPMTAAEATGQRVGATSVRLKPDTTDIR